jgi:tetrapyrrole methylase family protein / MazG family protein
VSEGFYDVSIVGLGIRGPLQVTRETDEVLRSCRVIHYVATEPDAVDYLAGFRAELNDLHRLYTVGRERMPVYRAMTEAVLRDGRERPPTALALYGHPMMFVTPSRMIRVKADLLGLRTRVLPAISALDCLMVDLNLDPNEHGLVQYEVNYALLYRPSLDPNVPCLLWQVGSAESTLYAMPPRTPNRFVRLRNYLRQFFPAEHVVALAVTATRPEAESDVTWLTLRDLPDAYYLIQGLTTLYIPRVGRRWAEATLASGECAPRPP